MSKLLIQTQVMENYAWREDGSLGVGADAYWKFKGGEDFFIPKFKGGEEAATMAVMALRSQIEEDNQYFRRQIIGWSIVANDYMTEFEKSQLEYEGKITYKAKELAW